MRHYFFALLAMIYGMSANAQTCSPTIDFKLSPPNATTSPIAAQSGSVTESFNSRAHGALPSSGSFANGNFTKSGTATIQPNDVWGGSGSNYMKLSQNAVVNVTLSQPSRYLGFWWGAGDAGNVVRLYGICNGSERLLGTFTTSTILSLLSNPTVEAVDGNNYNSSLYRRSNAANEPFAYVNLEFNDPSFFFSRLEFTQTTGGFLEIDNITTSTSYGVTQSVVITAPNANSFPRSTTNQIAGAFSISGFGATDIVYTTIRIKNPPSGTTLRLNTRTGLTAAFGYSITSNFTVMSFTGTQSSVNSALADLRLNTGSVTGNVEIEVSATLNTSGYFYLPENGHFYRPMTWPSGVSGGDAAYNQIKNLAAGQTFRGKTGYLITITSQIEQDFIQANVPGSNILIALTDRAVEGVFRWDAGPENGQMVRNGSSNVSGQYNNWCSSEPNNWGPGEDYVVTKWSGGNCWNDFGPPASNFPSSVSGYVIEFGTGTGTSSQNWPGFFSRSVTHQIVQPTIAVSTTSIAAFSACEGSASSANSFTVSGSALQGNVNVSAPTGFEVSLSSGSGYSSSVAISASGTLSARTVYVRRASTPTGARSGNITVSSTGATSRTIAVSGTINLLPSLASAVSASRCSNGTVNLSVSSIPSGSTIDWYAAATGGSVLSGGTSTTSFTTPSISTTTTYYAQTRNTSTGCVSSSRRAVIATVNPLPGLATAVNGERCGTGTVNLSVSSVPSGSTIDWYAAATGGSVLSGGTSTTSFTSPSISTTTTYYAQTRNTTTGCVSSSRRAVIATVNPLPGLATAVNGERCGTGTVNLSVNSVPSSSTIDWYAAATGGSVLSGGTGTTNFTTPSINSTTSYYAQTRNTTTGCVSSSRRAVNAIIETSPDISYPQAQYTFFSGDLITPITPSNAGGSATNWTISPALPGGLSFNTSNGAITGTATNGFNNTTYQISASNSLCPAENTSVDLKAINCFTFDANDFAFRGNASVSGSTITLTPNQGQQFGAVWGKDRIVLTENFRISSELYFGNNNAGADGLAFVIQSLSTNQGSTGGGLGYGGINPSLAIEFDTYFNSADPFANDHMAVMLNGDAGNHNNFASPIDLGNIEDGQWHNFEILWDASSNNLKVYFDNVLRFNLTIDLINTIFSGDPNTYVGFTASTGGASNEHVVRNIENCVDRLLNELPTMESIANFSSCKSRVTDTITFKINDDTTPTNDLTISGNSSNTSLVPNNQIVFGGSDSNRTIQLTPLPGVSGTATITITVTDQDGASSNSSFNVTFEDNTPPVVSTKNIIIALDASGNASITPNMVDSASFDNCSIDTMTLSQQNFDCSHVGSNTVTLTVTDENGNSNTANAIVTVIDTTQPVVITKNITVTLDASGNASITTSMVDSASSDNCGIDTRSLNQTNFDCSHVGNNTVTLTVTDINGNTNTADANVTVIDTTQPTVITKNIIVALDANGNASITPNMVDYASSDNCGIDSMFLSQSTFNCQDVAVNTASFNGQTTLNFNGTDNYVENTSTIPISPSHTITAWIKSTTINRNVFGWGGPGINNYTSVSFQGGSLRYYAGDGTPPVQSVSGIQNVIDGNWHHIAISRSNSGTVKIFVDGVLDATGSVTKITNNTSHSSIASLFANGSFQGLFNGQIDDLSVWSTALDDNKISDIYCGSLNMLDSDLVAFYDFNGSSGDGTLIDLKGNYNGSLINTNTNAAWVPFGTDVALQNCSSGTQIVLSVKDVNNNISTANAIVTVIDTIQPIVITKNITVALDANGNASITANLIDNASTDNCGIDTMTLSQQNFDCSHVGSNNVTLTITDVNGNSNTANAMVNIIDTIQPIVITKNITVALDANGNASITPNMVDSASTDNCGIDTRSLNQTNFDCSHVGNNTVTLTVTDVNGNTNTANAMVNIIDTIQPIVITKNIIVALDANGNASITPNMVDNASSDNCGIDTMTLSQQNFDCSHVGNNTVILTVADVNGNSNTANALVTVIDTMQPIVITKNITVALDANGNTSITPIMVDSASSDNCGIDTMTLSQQNFDCSHVGSNTVTLSVTDVNGNTNTANAIVTVIDTIQPTIITRDLVVFLDAFGQGSISINEVDSASFDACSIVNRSLSQTTFDCNNLGNNTITLTAIDVNGNIGIGSTNIEVRDTILPVPQTQNLTVFLDSAGNANILASEIDNGSSDNCGIANRIVLPNTFNGNNLDTNIVTLTVTDLDSNQASKNAIVVVKDTIKPFVQHTFSSNNPTLNNYSCGSVHNFTLGPNSCISLISIAKPNWADNVGVVNTSIAVSNNVALLNLGDMVFGNFPAGTTTITFTASDISNNSNSCEITINVIDNQTPTITAPADITVNANSTCSASSVALGTPTTADNCGVASVSNNAPATFPIGATTVTWTVTDNVGNSATDTQIVSVVDVTNPTITAPADITVNASAACVGIITNLGTPIANDNCGLASVTNNAPANFPLGVTNVIWTATDSSGNTSSASQTITVIDNTPPVIANLPANITVNNDVNLCSAVVNWTLPSASDSCSTVNLSSSHNSGDVFPTGTTTVVYTATDLAGNTTTASFNVTVVDNETPTITAPADITANANSACNAFGVTLGTPTAADNCGIASVSNNAPATFPIGATTVTWTVTDNAGNTTTDTQIVTVVDVTNPTITAPADITVNASAACVGIITNLGTPIANDNCGLASVTNNAPANFPLGVTNVIWTATDSSGNTSSATQTITVIDNTPPVIANLPANITVNNDVNLCSAVVNWTLPSASDSCSTVNLSSSHNSGDVFPIGTTTVVYTATDLAGNTTTASFNVSVVDNEIPTITAPADITANANSACSAFGVALGTPTAADNCGVASVSNNAPATFPIGATTVTWTVTDNAGNTVTDTQIVTVVDVTNPTITAPADITVNASAACVGIIPNLGTPIANDNCGVTSVTNNAPATFPLGVTNVIWTATDSAGNTRSATQTITVIDNTPPVIANLPANITVNNDVNLCSAVVNWTLPSASDSCSTVNLSSSHNSGDVFSLGTTTVLYTATDLAGNTTTASFNVTVVDNETPTITAPADITANANSACNAFGVTLGTPTAADNCGVASVSNNAPATFPIGATTVTWTVTDNAGNTATDTQIVTVVDVTNPTITAPADITVNASAACVGIIPNLGTPIANDNCGVTSVTNNAPATFPLGVTNVIWTATDSAGNTRSATQTITVIDNTPPVIANLPANITVNNDVNLCSAVVNWTLPSASDSCSTVNLSSSHNSGDVFSLGTTTVLYTATDLAGNTTTASFNVTVVDNETPTITAPADITANANSACNAFGVSLGTPTAADNCGVASVSNNAPATFPFGATTVTWTVTDNAGNTATDTQIVTVVDVTNPTLIVPPAISLSPNNGCEATNVELGLPSANDNCGIASILNDAPAAFPIGTTVVTWTATDNAGNQTSLQQLVTVNDLVPPTPVLVDSLSMALKVGEDIIIIPEMIDLGSFDNCGSVLIELSKSSFNCNNIGDNVIDVSVFDEAGNRASAKVILLVLPSGIDEDFDGVDDACDDDVVLDRIVLPNAFTPNGDGINDNFVIQGLQFAVKNHFTVYNRFGVMVYDNENYLNDWDGNGLNGSPLPDGTYYVILTIENGESFKSSVYINRVE